MTTARFASPVDELAAQFKDIKQRLASLERSVNSGGGTTGLDEVFIGTSDPGSGYELWYDTDALGVPAGRLYVRVGGAWVPAGSRLVGIAVGTATTYTNNTATETDVTVTGGSPPSLTLSLDTTRWYKATYVGRFLNTTPGGEIGIRFVEGGVARKALVDGPLAASARTYTHIHVFQPASAAATVYKIQAAPVGTVGVLTASASAASPMQFFIELL